MDEKNLQDIINLGGREVWYHIDIKNNVAFVIKTDLTIADDVVVAVSVRMVNDRFNINQDVKTYVLDKNSLTYEAVLKEVRTRCDQKYRTSLMALVDAGFEKEKLTEEYFKKTK